jgi:hypothetical protein
LEEFSALLVIRAQQMSFTAAAAAANHGLRLGFYLGSQGA